MRTHPCLAIALPLVIASCARAPETVPVPLVVPAAPSASPVAPAAAPAGERRLAPDDAAKVKLARGGPHARRLLRGSPAWRPDGKVIPIGSKCVADRVPSGRSRRA